MGATQGSGALFRALTVLLVILSLAILVGSLLLIASENGAPFTMLRDLSRLLSGEADVARAQAAVLVIVMLGAVTLPVAIMLISILFRDARIREHQHAAEFEQHQRERQLLQSSMNRLTETNRTQAAGISHANEQILTAAKTCREVSKRLQDGSSFESAHLLAAGSLITEVIAVMDEMTEYAEESAAVARESMQMAADETCTTTQQIEEAFYYFADLLRRMAQISQKQSGSVAGVGKSIESISEISRRSAESAAVLSQCGDDLKK